MHISRNIKTSPKMEYGTQHKCKVISSTNLLIVVIGDDGEGYLLALHGIKDLPKEEDIGKITFVKNDSSVKGHWHYEGVKEGEDE